MVTVARQVDSGKAPIRGEAALDVTRGVDALWVAKGKKVVHVDLRTARPSRVELLRLLLGPTGGLRAPTLRVGRTLLVGFNEEAYAAVLK